MDIIKASVDGISVRKSVVKPKGLFMLFVHLGYSARPSVGACRHLYHPGLMEKKLCLPLLPSLVKPMQFRYWNTNGNGAKFLKVYKELSTQWPFRMDTLITMSFPISLRSIRNWLINMVWPVGRMPNLLTGICRSNSCRSSLIN
ncbi:hypothetical protein D3C72_1541940 [compost metagenome]